MKKRALSFLLVIVMTFTLFPWSAIPANAFTWADWVIETEAKYFDVKPFIDGFVSVEEWGEPTWGVYQDSATVTGDRDPGLNNSFFYSDETYDENFLSMEYELWLRWDEKYFYVAVKASDPDGHSLKNGRFDTWNGDAFEMRIDPAGENGICYGDTFNAAEYAFNGYKPWSSASVCDLVFGYVERANGYSEAYDNTDGAVGRGMTEFSDNPMGAVDLAIVPAGYQYSTDSANGITTYEIAVPWAYIDSWYYRDSISGALYGHEYYEYSTKPNKDGTKGPNGAIGREYGISTVLYNADPNTGGDRYNALLAWGSGISDVQIKEALETCGGSNEVVLVADKVSENSSYNANYTRYSEGGYVATKKIPGYGVGIDQDRYVKLTYDNESDMDMIGWISNGERVRLDDGNWVVKWDKATGLEKPDENGEFPRLNTSTFISTAGDEGEGSRYFVPDNSFTFEFDIMVTGLESFDDSLGSEIYNLFGGIGGTDYKCGYSFDDGKFRIIDNNTDKVIAESYRSSFTLNEWHHWVFQYDDETCTVRFYVDPDDVPSYGWTLTPDADFGTMYKARPIFDDGRGLGIIWRYFDYGNTIDPLLAFGRSNAQIMLDNIEMYNFVDFKYAGNSKPTYSGTFGADGDNLTWALDPSYGILTISGEGAMDNYFVSAPWDEHCDIIREIIINEGVTTVGARAFAHCNDIENATIPSTVTSMGSRAFYSFEIKNVYISDLGAWCGIEFDGQYSSPLDTGMFNHPNLYINGRLATDINIPEGVTSINNHAFSSCGSIKSVKLPESVTSIGDSAFFNCPSLKSVSIPGRVTSIGEDAFRWCISLKSMKLPESVTSIGESAFYNCESLESINIPSGVTRIEYETFYGCKLISQIDLPEGLTSIGDWAFIYCKSIKSLVLPEGLRSIGTLAFCDCSSLTGITIPDSVTSIGDFAFSGCSSITRINIPDGITNTGDGTFSGCTSLKSVYIPDSVTIIGGNAFSGCSSLESINLPSGVTSIGGAAFSRCSSLRSINIPSGVESIGWYAFTHCSSLTSINIPSGVTSIEAYTFSDCTSLERITIPKSVTSVGGSAFRECNSLKTVYYTGTEKLWNRISIADDNEPLLSANIIFNYEPEIVLGDVSGDGEVNMKDVILIRQSLVGLTEIDPDPADVNGDGAVNMKDVILIRQYLVGIIDKFPA